MLWPVALMSRRVASGRDGSTGVASQQCPPRRRQADSRRCVRLVRVLSDASEMPLDVRATMSPSGVLYIHTYVRACVRMYIHTSKIEKGEPERRDPAGMTGFLYVLDLEIMGTNTSNTNDNNKKKNNSNSKNSNYYSSNSNNDRTILLLVMVGSLVISFFMVCIFQWPRTGRESSSLACAHIVRHDGLLRRNCEQWAVTCVPMPMPKTVCRTCLHNKIVQLEVCITFSGGVWV